MSRPDASQAGTFAIAGQLEVCRLGFGAMRVTGEGVWGEPPDRAECLATLREVPELGVNFIDTADAYGPTVSEPMLKEALHPYPDGTVIATKGGQLRTGPNEWIPLGRPEYLRQQALLSQRLLGVEQITLWQLHRIDPQVPPDQQFGAIKSMLDDGLIRFAGLSEVTVEEIKAAQKIFPVATVQNRYNAGYRMYDDVLDYCEEHAIGFIPWAPLSAGALTRADSPLAEIARRHEATPAQIAIAWLLRRSPCIVLIPGTSKRAHLEQNVAAAAIDLSDDEFDALMEIRHVAKRN